MPVSNQHDLILAEARKRLIAETKDQFGSDQAQDFAQDTFVKFYRSRVATSGEWTAESITSYLLILLRQVVSDYLDAPAVKYETGLQETDTVTQLSPAQRSVWWEACRDEIRGLLRLTPLSPMQRRCVRLRMENNTQEEIAFQLGFSQQAISRMLEAAETALRRRAEKSSVFVILSLHDFRAISKITQYRRPQTLGSFLTNQKLRRLNIMPLRVTKEQAKVLQHRLDDEPPDEIKVKKYRDNEEAREQALLFVRRTAYLQKYRTLRWMFATLNGVYIPPAILKQMIEQGIVRGVLDIWLPIRRIDPGGAIWSGLVIDMKSDIGSPTTEQLEWAAHLVANGYRAYFCSSAVEAWRVICIYLNISGADHLARDMESQSEAMKRMAAALKAAPK